MPEIKGLHGPHEETQEQQGGKIDLFRGTDVTSGGGLGWAKQGDKGGEDEGQKTQPVEIKRDDEEEKRRRAQKCFNELNEVIRSQDLILQDLGTVGAEKGVGVGRR